MTSARQIYLGSRRGPALPYDAEVEYLESTGTQWIDTGLYVDMSDSQILSKIRFSRDFAYMARLNLRTPFWGLAPVRADYGVTGGVTGQGQGQVPISVSVGGWHNIDDTSHRLTVDGTALLSRTPYNATTAGTMLLFGGNLNGVVAPGQCAIRRFSIISKNVLVRDMISVRFTNEQGVSEGAMYDRVSGQLFRNSGTGAFNYGNDK